MVKDNSDSEGGNLLPPHGLIKYFRLAARVLLYIPSHRLDNTYYGLCHTSRGALAGTTDLNKLKYVMKRNLLKKKK